MEMSFGSKPPRQKLAPEGASMKKDFRTSQQGFGVKKDFRTSQQGFGVNKDFRTSQQGFGAKKDRKDFRTTAEGFGAKKDFRTTQERFGAKRELSKNVDSAPSVCEDPFEEFLAAPADEPVPDAVTKYRSPWEDSLPGEEAGKSEYANEANTRSRTPTPTFGNWAQKGLPVDLRSTGMGGVAAKNSKPPVASVARMKNFGVRESRWSGA
jgi:hypothetical protein